MDQKRMACVCFFRRLRFGFTLPAEVFFPNALGAVWFLSVLIALFGFALLMLRFWHTYYDRTLREVTEEWDRRAPTIEIIGGYLHAGEKLQQEEKNPAYEFDNDFIERLNDWHKNAASQLWQRLGEESKDRFYKGSKILEETPSNKGQFALWMHDRLHFLRTVVSQQKLLPDQLTKESCRQHDRSK